MKDSGIVKLFCSIPIIMLALYLIPVLGVLLMIVRFIFVKRKGYLFQILLIILGCLLLVPSLVNWVFANYLSTHAFAETIKKIVESDLYNKLFGYGKLLIIVGVLFIIIVYVVQRVLNKLGTAIGNKIRRDEAKMDEIHEKNDLIMKERREEVKNSHVVICKSCGNANVLRTKIGKCQYCRKQIEYEEKN